CSGLLVFGQGFDSPRLHHQTTLILIRNQRCYFLPESPHCSGLFAFVPFGYQASSHSFFGLGNVF
ncbi:MAG: hypothetical protein Q4C10_04700, partial [Clostridia bacterium]|nr:hypothetical protein [Clostridia bacterium]